MKKQLIFEGVEDFVEINFPLYSIENSKGYTTFRAFHNHDHVEILEIGYDLESNVTTISYSESRTPIVEDYSIEFFDQKNPHVTFISNRMFRKWYKIWKTTTTELKKLKSWNK